MAGIDDISGDDLEILQDIFKKNARQDFKIDLVKSDNELYAQVFVIKDEKMGFEVYGSFFNLIKQINGSPLLEVIVNFKFISEDGSRPYGEFTKGTFRLRFEKKKK